MHPLLLLSPVDDACWCDVPRSLGPCSHMGSAPFQHWRNRWGGSQCPPLLLFLSPISEEGEQKRMLFNLKVKNSMPLFGSAKATSSFDSDESLLAAWAGGRPPGPSGEIDWKENTWLNLLPAPSSLGTPPLLSAGTVALDIQTRDIQKASSTNRVTLLWVTYFT